LVGHRGEELIHLFAMAMKYEIAAARLKEMVFGFPTFAADLKSLV
jgi:glutathione reductase (NADPH)